MTITELEQAINRARQQAPARGPQAALTADVALMAQVYGELIYRRHKGFDLDSLDDAARDALRRWHLADGAQTADAA